MKMRDEFGPSYSAGVGSRAEAPQPPKAPGEELYVSEEYRIFVVVNGIDPGTENFHRVAVRPFHDMPPDVLGKMLPLAKPCNGKFDGIEIWVKNGQNLMFSDARGNTLESISVADLDPEVRDRIHAKNAAADQQVPFNASLWKKYLDAAAAVIPPEPQVTTGHSVVVRKPLTLKLS